MDSRERLRLEEHASSTDRTGMDDILVFLGNFSHDLIVHILQKVTACLALKVANLSTPICHSSPDKERKAGDIQVHSVFLFHYQHLTVKKYKTFPKVCSMDHEAYDLTLARKYPPRLGQIGKTNGIPLASPRGMQYS
jgi:hypothetical protein